MSMLSHVLPLEYFGGKIGIAFKINKVYEPQYEWRAMLAPVIARGDVYNQINGYVTVTQDGVCIESKTRKCLSVEVGKYYVVIADADSMQIQLIKHGKNESAVLDSSEVNKASTAVVTGMLSIDIADECEICIDWIAFKGPNLDPWFGQLPTKCWFMHKVRGVYLGFNVTEEISPDIGWKKLQGARMESSMLRLMFDENIDVGMNPQAVKGIDTFIMWIDMSSVQVDQQFELGQVLMYDIENNVWRYARIMIGADKTIWLEGTTKTNKIDYRQPLVLLASGRGNSVMIQALLSDEYIETNMLIYQGEPEYGLFHFEKPVEVVGSGSMDIHGLLLKPIGE